jgi:hypothetical protein
MVLTKDGFQSPDLGIWPQPTPGRVIPRWLPLKKATSF